MKLKIFIAVLAFLFTVKLATAQVSIQYGTSVANTGPTNAFPYNFMANRIPHTLLMHG